MKSKFCVVLLLALLLGACGAATDAPTQAKSAPIKEETAPADAAATGEDLITEAAPSQTAAQETPAPAPSSSTRAAVVSETEKTVHVREHAGAQRAPASAGMKVLPGGGVETGGDGRARLDLLPEKTIVRVGPNSSFTMPTLTETDGAPVTTFDLLFGKIYILLNGGSLTVTTPGGVATAQGSVMSVEYDPKIRRVKTACLEGHCKVKDQEGNEIELTDDEMSFIYEDEPPTDPEIVDSEEIEEWLEEIPEMPEFFDDLPDPEDFPEPEITEEPTIAPEATLDPGATPDLGATPDPGATSEPEATPDPGSGGDPSGGDPGGGDTGGGDPSGGDPGSGDPGGGDPGGGTP